MAMARAPDRKRVDMPHDLGQQCRQSNGSGSGRRSGRSRTARCLPCSSGRRHGARMRQRRLWTATPPALGDGAGYWYPGPSTCQPSVAVGPCPQPGGNITVRGVRVRLPIHPYLATAIAQRASDHLAFSGCARRRWNNLSVGVRQQVSNYSRPSGPTLTGFLAAAVQMVTAPGFVWAACHFLISFLT